VTILYARPSFDLTNVSTPNSSNQSSMLCLANNVLRHSLRGFAVDGSNHSFTGAAAMAVVTAPGIISDVRVAGFKNVNRELHAAGGTQAINCKIELSGGYGIVVEVLGASFVDCYVGNCGAAGLRVTGVDGTSNTSRRFTWVNGIIDESTGNASEILGSTDVNFIGATIHGPQSTFASSVDATSIVTYAQCALVPYSTSGNRSGLTVASGGVARIVGCRFGKTGTGKEITNAGTVYDLGGNSYLLANLSGTAPLAFAGSNAGLYLRPTACRHYLRWINNGDLRQYDERLGSHNYRRGSKSGSGL
jgi:hypothetical protein